MSKIQLNNYFGIESKKIGQVTLTIDLRSYIEAFNRHQSNQTDKHLLRNYEALYQDISSEIRGVNGQQYWENLFYEAVKNFPQTQIEAIRASPAFIFMNNSFVELLKNVMDESILSRNTQRIEMELNIECTQDKVIFTFKDTGRGFSDSFLHKVSDRQHREQYLNSFNSDKLSSHMNLNKGNDIEIDHETLSDNDINTDLETLCLQEHESLPLPNLFGGAGRGLKILIAQVEHGKEFVHSGFLNHKYITSETSRIDFANRENGSGAIITIATSIEPLQLNNQIQQEYKVEYSQDDKVDKEQEVVLKLPSQRFKKMISSQSEEKVDEQTDTNKENSRLKLPNEDFDKKENLKSDEESDEQMDPNVKRSRL